MEFRLNRNSPPAIDKTRNSHSAPRIPHLAPRNPQPDLTQPRYIHPTGQFAHLGTDHLLGFCQGVVDCSQHQILEHFNIVRIDDFIFNLNRCNLLAAVGDDGYHAPAGTRFNGPISQFFL